MTATDRSPSWRWVVSLSGVIIMTLLGVILTDIRDEAKHANASLERLSSEVNNLRITMVRLDERRQTVKSEVKALSSRVMVLEAR